MADLGRGRERPKVWGGRGLRAIWAAGGEFFRFCAQRGKWPRPPALPGPPVWVSSRRMNSDVDAILRRYLVRWPGETGRQRRFGAFLDGHPSPGRLLRTNFAGHLTASGIVVDRSRERVLLIHHKRLDCWLQPGGHVELSDESLAEAARREVTEETGIPPAGLRLIGEGGEPLPIDLDSHDIPASAKKNEPAHVHHDVRYLFEVVDDHALSAQAAEVHAAKWWPIDEAAAATDLAGALRKVRQLNGSVA